MDIFVDKNGKKVLTIKDNGDEIKDEKYFKDKRLEAMSDTELIEEYLKRGLPEGKFSDKARELINEAAKG